jgi:selenocysteine lyase/cysteine desulfurase
MQTKRKSSQGSMESLRREFHIPRGTTFLNHASFGPVPRSARAAVESLFRRQGDFRGDPDVDAETFSNLADLRKMFAKLTGAHAKRVAFVPNASYGINAILNGLNLKPGERILVPANEFPAAVYAARSLCDRTGVELVSVPCSKQSMDMDHLYALIRQGAAVLLMSWIQYFNGFRYDLAPIARLCHEHGVFHLVDVTQGAGAVPLNMRREGVDAIAAGTQKWLLGQTGGGFFAVAPNPIRPVVPTYGGWLGYDWGYAWGDLQRWDRPAFNDGRFWEVGTYPFYSVRLAHAGLSILTKCGTRRAYTHILSLHARLAEGLRSTKYRIIVFPSPRNRSGIVSFTGPQTAALHKYLLANRIFVSLREGNIRVSPHFYNTMADMDRLITFVRRFEKSLGTR